MPTKLTIKIKNGKVDVDVDGMTGQGCKKITDALAKAVGKIEKETPKPDMHRETTVDQTATT